MTNNNFQSIKIALRPLAAAARWWRLPYAASLMAPGLALAGPTGGDVIGGDVSIAMPDASHTVINQASQNAIVNWQQFSVGSDEYVIFNQPNASSAILNRIIGGNASEILGNITANGRVFLINPQGIVFGEGARIDVGGLVATTLDIKNEDFMAGRYVFAGNSKASVVNNGAIKSAANGFVVLAGDYVNNKSVIEATAGTVVLASGSKMTLDMDGNGLINLAIDEAALSEHAGVENAGSVIADGGRVVMTAKTAGELARTTVNNSGLVRAQGITTKGGAIYLTAAGGSVSSSGTLDASGKNGYNGGNVQVRADGNIRHAGSINVSGKNGGVAQLVAKLALTTELGSLIDARADDPASGKGGFVELSGHQSFRLNGQTQIGSGGTLLLDPNSFTISGGDVGGASNTLYEKDIEDQLNSGTNVEIVATNDIFAYGSFSGVGIDSTGSGKLTLGIGSLDTTTSPAPDDVFIRGDGSIGHGNIDLRLGGEGGDPLDFNLVGGLRLVSGRDYGGVMVGDIVADDLSILAADGIVTGNITAVNSVTLTGGEIDLIDVDVSGTDIHLTSTTGDIHIFGTSLTATGDLEIVAHQDLKIEHSFYNDFSTYGYNGYYYFYAYQNVNRPSTLSGNHITLTAQTGALNIIGSTVSATGDLDVTASGDLSIKSSYSSTTQYSYQLDENYDVVLDQPFLSRSRTPYAYSSLSGNNVTLESQTGQVDIWGADINATGDLTITAHNDLTVAPSYTTYDQNDGNGVTYSTAYYPSSSTLQGRNVTLTSTEGGVNIFGSFVTAGSTIQAAQAAGEGDPPPPDDGVLTVHAQGDLWIDTGFYSSYRHEDNTGESTLYNESHTAGYDGTGYGSVLSGRAITLTSDTSDVRIYGSTVAAEEDLRVEATAGSIFIGSSFSSFVSNFKDPYGNPTDGVIDNHYDLYGSELSGRDITLVASGDADGYGGGISIRGSSVTASGDLTAAADVWLNIGSNYSSVTTYSDGKDTDSRAYGSTLNGDNITLTATAEDVGIHGSSITASGDLTITAGTRLAINSSYDTSRSISQTTTSNTYGPYGSPDQSYLQNYGDSDNYYIDTTNVSTTVTNESTAYTAHGSALSGTNITLTASTSEVAIHGSSVEASGDLTIGAGTYLTVGSSYDGTSSSYSSTTNSHHTYYEYTAYYIGDTVGPNAGIGYYDDVVDRTSNSESNSVAHGSTLSGNNITLTAADEGISLFGSTVEATGDLTMTAGRGISVNTALDTSYTYESTYYSSSDNPSSYISEYSYTNDTDYVTAPALNGAAVTLTAEDGNIFIFGASITADSLHLLASSTALAIGSFAVTESPYPPREIDNIRVADSTVDAGALEAVSTTGSISFEGSTTTVGTGEVAATSEGADPDLLASLNEQAADLLPSDLDSTPNAVFIGAEGVHFGKLIMKGNYLYVEAPADQTGLNYGGTNLKIGGVINYVGPGDIDDDGDIEYDPQVETSDHPLIYNVVPYNDDDNIILYAPQVNTLQPPFEVSLSIGSDTFAGDITVSTDDPLSEEGYDAPLGLGQPIVDPNFNFAMLTKGAVAGTNNITLPGKVVVLKPVAKTTPATTTTNTEASTAINSLSTDNLNTGTSDDSGDQKKRRQTTDTGDTDTSDDSHRVIRVRDSKPLDLGKSCT